MQFCRMLSHDVEQGILSRKVYFLLALLLSFFACFGLHTQMQDLQRSGLLQGKGTFMDYWLYLIDGSGPYQFDIMEFFIVPPRWTGFFLFLLISLNTYPLQDLKGWGVQALVRSKSRWIWWLGKVLWCILYALVYFIICSFIITVFAVSNGAAVDLKPSAEVMRCVAREDFALTTVGKLVCIAMVQPFLLAVFSGLVQMVLSFILQPIFAFMIVFGMLVASTYQISYFLPGNWGMAWRMYGIVDSGLKPEICICLMAVGILLCMIVGYYIFRKRDILE